MKGTNYLTNTTSEKPTTQPSPTKKGNQLIQLKISKKKPDNLQNRANEENKASKYI